MLLGVKYYFDNGITNDYVPDATVIEINKNKYSENEKFKFHTSYLERTIINLVQQRNNMSRAMNLKQQKIGQMECEVCTIKFLIRLYN
jgi:hypothetical protein